MGVVKRAAGCFEWLQTDCCCEPSEEEPQPARKTTVRLSGDRSSIQLYPLACVLSMQEAAVGQWDSGTREKGKRSLFLPCSRSPSKQRCSYGTSRKQDGKKPQECREPQGPSVRSPKCSGGNTAVACDSELR